MSEWKRDNVTLGDSYDYAQFTLTSGQTNYNVSSNQSALFYNIKLARGVIIETTTNISVRFNNTAMPAINLDAGASPLELINKINVTNIFLTNSSGSSSTIRIWLFI